ncbi:hypothetical protein [Photorhabdus heterorhabditis]|uniref:Uncharacterized protein n=1 Tax=Photorhabdus heterorhabditis TaxID=880156 RepID=A0A5B0X8H9_9GAMM|nr:hypothetical protein [Photorhabdus heterorhabditis]KAA1194838.1 hypothetical protein F0L16_03945 [Photorhabdus heterorhabditis]
MTEYEEKVLAFDMFEGDFGDGSERCLKDKIGITRKESRCHICDEIIPAKSTARLSTWVFDCEIINYRCCEMCCDAMSACYDGDDETIELRYQLREFTE